MVDNGEDAKDFSTLIPPTWFAEHIPRWLSLDIPKFDVGGLVVGDTPATASILCKSPGVCTGFPFAEEVFRTLGCSVQWLHPEGKEVNAEEAKSKIVIGKVTGPTRRLLQGERTALNILARASGIATLARRFVRIAEEAGWKGHIAGTRKTTPGAFALVEKYALLVGGASTHRMDLSQMTMLKDNHIWAKGGIEESIRAAKRAAGFAGKIDVECRDLDEAWEAVNAGADIVMLDNFPPEDAASAAAQLKAKYPRGLTIEVSGGIRESTLKSYLAPHADVVSIGALTQGYSTVDFSMKLPRPSRMASSQL